MAKFAALDQPVMLSEAKMGYLRGFCSSRTYGEMTRLTAILNVVSSTPRPTNPAQTISDQLVMKEKMHDREPEALIAELERRFPGFWDALPHEDELTDQKKGKFLSEFARVFFRQGKSAYGKPLLRSVEEPVDEVVAVG